MPKAGEIKVILKPPTSQGVRVRKWGSLRLCPARVRRLLSVSGDPCVLRWECWVVFSFRFQFYLEYMPGVLNKEVVLDEALWFVNSDMGVSILSSVPERAGC